MNEYLKSQIKTNEVGFFMFFRSSLMILESTGMYIILWIIRIQKVICIC